MKHYIVKFFGLLALCAMTSCLDFEPESQLGDTALWKSANDFKLFANQFYGWTRDFNAGVNDSPHSDLRSDILTTGGGNMYSAGNIQIPASDGTYTGAYDRIRNCNLLLQKAEAYGGNDIAQYVAEAKFFRAYIYFELVQLYGDVILTLKPLDLDSPELKTSRTDRGKVIDQIVKDLQEAAPALPETTTEAGRLTSGAAWAMLSRAALYEGTWQKFHNENTARAAELLAIAADAAKKVIDTKQYELFKSDRLGTMSYKYLFTLENVQCNPANLTKADNKEYILVTRHDEVLKRIGINITHAALGNVYWITRKYANMYLCSNGLPIDKAGDLFKGYATTDSEFQNRDNRMANQMVRHGQKVWDNEAETCRVDWLGEEADLAHSSTVRATAGSGYQNQKWATERRVQDYYEGYDYPVIRYAEVLLNYVEARFEAEDKISDADLAYLNQVRQRVNPDMPALTNKFVADNGLDMREEIRRERTVELFLEGFRIDDLKRWATAEEEMPGDLLGIKWKDTQFETIWSSDAQPRNAEGCRIMQSGRVFEKKHYLYPLPSDQRQLNPNLGQNPDWGK